MRPGIDWVYDRLDEFIKQNYTIFDVGAHRGEYTEKLLNLTGPSGKVYAFELNAENYGALINKFSKHDNVTITNVAVSDCDGQVDYYRGGCSYTGNIIGHDTSYKDNKRAGEIQSIRLDSFYPEGVIDFIKIDVEGAELRVLHGLKGIIHNVRKMLIECHFENDWPELRSLIMDEYGFSTKNIHIDKLIGPDSVRPPQCLCWRE